MILCYTYIRHWTQYIVYLCFASDRWMNDIALVKLDRDLPLAPSDPFIDIVTLPTSIPADWPPTGSNCSMQGWGCSAEGNLSNQRAPFYTDNIYLYRCGLYTLHTFYFFYVQPISLLHYIETTTRFYYWPCELI